MKKKVLIVKNIALEGPGLIEEIIIRQGIEYTIIDLSQSLQYPFPGNFGAVIVLGGPDSANDKSPKIEALLKLIGEVIVAKIPFLGICLGLQAGVKAAGGEVVISHQKEIGFRYQDGLWYKVEVTREGRADALLKDIEHTFNVFHLHGETVILTESMKLLGAGKNCQNQIVKINSNSYGIQCHFELTREMFELWINNDDDLKKLDKNQLQSDFLASNNELRRTGSRIINNFLSIAGYLTPTSSDHQ